MIKLKQLLPEIALMSGDAAKGDMKDIFDMAFRNGVLPQKYNKLYQADSDEAKGIVTISHRPPTNKEKQKTQKLQQLNQITPEVLKYLDKYEKVGTSGNFVMILKNEAKQLHFMLCDKSADTLTEFFIGVIRVEKGNNSYNFTPKNAFNLKTYQIHWSNIAIEHKGSGLGRLMYKMVYDYITGSLGGALLSDSMLFEGSQKMWMQFVPSFASYFGVVVRDVFFPIDKSEISGDVMGRNVDAMVAMETMPKEIRKIAYNVKGLSFKGGEYGVIRIGENINAKLEKDPYNGGSDSRWTDFDEYIDKPKKKEKPEFTYFSNLVDEASTITGLLKTMEDDYDFAVGHLISNSEDISNLKACVLSFDNMNVIIKQGAGRLTMVAI